ncbi:MAG: hypothetical protein WCZ23_04005 [Rhodospirillaceae bacterium]
MAIERDPSQTERQLLDTIERAGRTPAGRTAVHLHLSDLLPGNRPPAHLRIAARLFVPLETAHHVQIFALSNGDIMVLGKDMPEDEVDRIVHRVRALFDRDPLAFTDFGEHEADPFVSWYALEVDYDDLHATVGHLLADAERRRDVQRRAEKPPPPMRPADLDTLQAKLAELDVRPMLRRQPCIRFQAKEANIAFEEVFISMADVRQALGVEYDLFADRWLFQDLSRMLDARTLAGLPETAAMSKPSTLSLNLNLESLDSSEFALVLGRLGPGQNLVVEVQVIDVFSNLPAFQKARDILREDGHSILIDGLHPAVLGALDLGLLDPDWIKIVWHPELAAPQHPRKSEEFADLVNDFGGQRVVLSRCDNETAVMWGLSKNITAFQGRFLDAVLGTVTMTKCPRAAGCTLKDCSARRSALGGRLRAECPNPSGLDAVTSFASPRRRPA